MISARLRALALFQHIPHLNIKLNIINNKNEQDPFFRILLVLYRRFFNWLKKFFCHVFFCKGVVKVGVL